MKLRKRMKLTVSKIKRDAHTFEKANINCRNAPSTSNNGFLKHRFEKTTNASKTVGSIDTKAKRGIPFDGISGIILFI